MYLKCLSHERTSEVPQYHIRIQLDVSEEKQPDFKLVWGFFEGQNKQMLFFFFLFFQCIIASIVTFKGLYYMEDQN